MTETPLETEVRNRLKAGETIDFGAVPDDRTPEKTLGAAFVRSIALEQLVNWSVAPAGIAIHGAIITGGDLDFRRLGSEANYLRALDLSGSTIKGGLLLDDSVWTSVTLSKCTMSRLDAQRVRVANRFLADSLRITANGNTMVDLRGATIGNHVVLNELGRAFLDTPQPTHVALNLSSATIGGSLFCHGAALFAASEPEYALVADGARIGGAVQLMASNQLRFEAKGQVRFLGAKVEGTFVGEGGLFDNGERIALSVEASSIGGAVLLRATPKQQIDVRGTLQLFAARVGGSVDLNGALVTNPNGLAVEASAIEIGGGLYLNRAHGHRFASKGQINLRLAKIARNFECYGASMENPTKTALAAEGIEVGGKVAMSATPTYRFEARGSLELQGAKVRNDFECEGMLIKEAREVALHIEGAEVGDAVLLRANDEHQFEAEGTVRLYAAKIGGNLDCGGAWIDGRTAYAVQAQGAEIGGTVFLRSYKGKPFEFSNHISLIGAQIRGSLIVRIGASRSKGTVFLSECHISELSDVCGEGWGALPSTEGEEKRGVVLELNGFVYRRLATWQPQAAKSWKDRCRRLFGFGTDSDLFHKRIAWLGRQYPEPGAYRELFPQPYEQLAKILRETGHDYDARRIIIEKLCRERKAIPGGFISPLLKWLFHWGFGFGYSPIRAFWTLVGWWLIGWLALSAAIDYSDAFVKATTPVEVVRVMSQPNTVPQSPGAHFKGDRREDGEWRYERFPPVQVREIPCSDVSPILYALDTMLPLLDLHQEEKCEMADDEYVWRWAKALYAVVGWIITALAALTWTGILRRVPD
jgi:hypothetical protein